MQSAKEQLRNAIRKKFGFFTNPLTQIFQMALSKYAENFLETTDKLEHLSESISLPSIGGLRELLLSVWGYDKEMVKVAELIINGKHKDYEGELVKLGTAKYTEKILEEHKMTSLEHARTLFQQTRNKLMELFTIVYQKHLHDDSNVYLLFTIWTHDTELLYLAGVDVNKLKKELEKDLKY